MTFLQHIGILLPTTYDIIFRSVLGHNKIRTLIIKVDDYIMKNEYVVYKVPTSYTAGGTIYIYISTLKDYRCASLLNII